jgi:hypothetical protein
VTYRPTLPDARRILAMVHARGSVSVRIPHSLADAIRGAVQHNIVDDETLRQALLALACPDGCPGTANHDAWHRLCETKANAALGLLT